MYILKNNVYTVHVALPVAKKPFVVYFIIASLIHLDAKTKSLNIIIYHELSKERRFSFFIPIIISNNNVRVFQLFRNLIR